MAPGRPLSVQSQATWPVCSRRSLHWETRWAVTPWWQARCHPPCRPTGGSCSTWSQIASTARVVRRGSDPSPRCSPQPRNFQAINSARLPDDPADRDDVLQCRPDHAQDSTRSGRGCARGLPAGRRAPRAPVPLRPPEGRVVTQPARLGRHGPNAPHAGRRAVRHGPRAVARGRTRRVPVSSSYESEPNRSRGAGGLRQLAVRGATRVHDGRRGRAIG